MEMASSEVEMSSSQTLNCVLRDRSRHEKFNRDNGNDINNVRTIQPIIEKNLKVFVRDHLKNTNCSISGDYYKGKSRDCRECSYNSPVSDRCQILPQTPSNPHHSLPSPPLGFDPKQLCETGQPENPSKNEKLGASSLVQIWEARLQSPHTSQSQSQTDNRTNSELSQPDNSNSNSCLESLKEECVREPELMVQPVDQENNTNNKEDVDMEEKEREGVRVMDIIRKLSNDPEMTIGISGNGYNESGWVNPKELQAMEQRSFPQVASTPRLRGRQAYENLLMQMVRIRQTELALLVGRQAVSKFTYRGRLQTMLKIRCLERCIAIQDRCRSKSVASDVIRGSGSTSLRDKLKTDHENSRIYNSAVEGRSSSRVNEASSTKTVEKCWIQEVVEKKVLQETMEKSDSREVIKKAVLSETAEDKISSKKVSIQQQTTEDAGKSIPKEIAEENTSMRIMEKVIQWNLGEKTNRKMGERTMGPKNVEERDKMEGKAIHQFIQKKISLQEAERRMINVKTAERSVENIHMREIVDMNNPPETSLATSLLTSVKEARGGREEEEATGPVSREGENENSDEKNQKKCVRDDEEVWASRNFDDKNGEKETEDKKKEKQESTGDERREFQNSRDEGGDGEDEEQCTDDDDDLYYNEENAYDWFNEISRPRSYWEDLRKQWYLEVLNTDSEKEDIRKLVERRTVSNFLSSDLREKIDRLMMSRVQRRVDNTARDPGEDELTDGYKETEENADKRDEIEEGERENRCNEAGSEGFSPSSSSGRSTMMSWSFQDCVKEEDEQEPGMSPSIRRPWPSDRSRNVPTTHDDTSEMQMQMICNLKAQIEQLQREMLQFKSSLNVCMDTQLQFQKSFNPDSSSASDQKGPTSSLKRKCCVCQEMPVDSLLYRCGHICTCLKCAHQLQWNSGKCPICLAPIVDVVRAFLDS